jgi:Fe-S-cluster containining protein
MLLSRSDIRLLERVGHDVGKFARFNKQGFAQLRNCRGCCIFYQADKHRCKIYRHRPLGCRIYPVMYDEEQRVVVDGLCPQAETVSKREILLKAVKLKRLLKRIDSEAVRRKGGCAS